MANAMLVKTIEKEEQQAGWAAPTSEWSPELPAPPTTTTMTYGGVASATGVLFVLLLGAGVVGWSVVDPGPQGEIEFPAWIFIAALAAFGLAMFAFFRPQLARFLAPLYALGEGLVLGAISRAFENEWDGIVFQAVLLTAAVFATMLFVYATGLVRVTNRMRRVIVTATISIALFYFVSLLFALFDVSVPLIWDAGPFGILFSVVVCGIAAFNLLLDFDLTERAVRGGLPKHFEWFCGLALMVSIVWLYLEILRLLSKLRD